MFDVSYICHSPPAELEGDIRMALSVMSLDSFLQWTWLHGRNLISDYSHPLLLNVRDVVISPWILLIFCWINKNVFLVKQCWKYCGPFLINVGLKNVLLPIWCQAITWTNAEVWSIRSLGTDLVKFKSKYNIFNSRKHIWIFGLHNVGHFAQALMWSL